MSENDPSTINSQEVPEVIVYHLGSRMVQIGSPLVLSPERQERLKAYRRERDEYYRKMTETPDNQIFV